MPHREGALGQRVDQRPTEEGDLPGERQDFTSKEIEYLIKKISSFSETIKNLLFFHYVFEHSIQETEEILGIESVGEKLRIIENSLAQSIGRKKLEVDVLQQLCQNVLKTEMDLLMQQSEEELPIYSESFQRKMMRMIPEFEKSLPDKVGNDFWRRLIQKVATFVCMIAILLGVHSEESGGKELEWKLQRFWNHNSFWSQYENGITQELDIKKIKINYIPAELDVAWIKERENGLLYWYCSADGQQSLRIQIGKGNRRGKFSYDAEGIKLKEIVINKHQAFYWEKAGKRCLLWQEAGFSFFIDGTIGEEELIKVANSILI